MSIKWMVKGFEVKHEYKEVKLYDSHIFTMERFTLPLGKGNFSKDLQWYNVCNHAEFSNHNTQNEIITCNAGFDHTCNGNKNRCTDCFRDYLKTLKGRKRKRAIVKFWDIKEQLKQNWRWK